MIKLLRFLTDIMFLSWFVTMIEFLANGRSVYVMPVAMALTGVFLVLYAIQDRIEKRKNL